MFQTNFSAFSTFQYMCQSFIIREGIEDNSKIIFSYFSMKTYVVTPHQNRLGETVLIVGHNLCFYGKFSLNYSSYLLLSGALYTQLRLDENLSYGIQLV